MEQQSKLFSKKLLIIIAALIIFAAIFYCVITDNAEWFDNPIREFFYNLRRPWLTPFVKCITYLGNWQLIIGFCLILLAFKKTRIKYGIPVSAGALILTVLNKFIKHFVARPRPDVDLRLIDVGGYSFTSGHSICSMFFYAMTIYLVRRYVKDRHLADFLTVLLAIPMLLVGLSRIYLGVHYPTDVLGGWCLGITAMIIGTIIIGNTKEED